MRRGLFDPGRKRGTGGDDGSTERGVPSVALPEPDRRVLTVSQVNAIVSEIVDSSWRLNGIWVEGEVSNVSTPPSGHVYFTLTDDTSRLSAVAFRGVIRKMGFYPKEGERLLAFGRVNVYQPQGEYQLLVERIEPAGVGAHRRALEELKNKLAAEGLFAADRKKPLPFLPRTVALVTSPSGAAIHDMIKVLTRRYPGVRIVVVPTTVQGESAGKEIVRAVRLTDEWGEADVMIMGRGGGAAEDLSAFNEEVVVRAIAAARTPVVSAVGHEIDVTIADLVADARAPTPSEAAELVVPDRRELSERLGELAGRISTAVRSMLTLFREHLDLLARSRALARPREIVNTLRQTADGRAVMMLAAMNALTASWRERVAGKTGELAALSPLDTLRRGYSITTIGGENRPLTDASGLTPGQRIESRLARGTIESVVEKTCPGTADNGERQ